MDVIDSIVDTIVDLTTAGIGADARVASTSLTAPQMAVLSHGAQVALSLPLRDSLAKRSIAFCYPDSPLFYPTTESEVDSQLEQATLVVQNLQTSVPVLKQICALTALHHRRLVTCSLYVSNPGSLAFDMHVDMWDVHIIQVSGHKRFWVADPADRVVESDMGTCLFIPEGVLHRADTLSRSVHLSFGTHGREE